MLILALLLALSPAEKTAAARITPAQISGHLRFLSDDQLEGRKPGQPGDELAIKYLASQLEAMGYQPAGDKGSFLQAVPMVELHADVPKDITFQKTEPGGSTGGRAESAGKSTGDKAVTLHTGGGSAADMVVEPNAHTDHAAVKDAPLVFVGYGITAPEYGWDDYKDLDVRGKIVLIMNFNPPFKGEGVRLWYGRWPYKYQNASKHGAAGAIVIHTTPSAGYPWQVLANSASGTHQDLPPSDADPKNMQFQAWATEAASMQIAKLGGGDLDQLRKAADEKGFKAQPLGVTLSLSMPVSQKQIQTANVVGLLPGTDPKLKEEAVLYTAHHDHLGRIPTAPGVDGIFNGALDNASGCATVLAIAQAATFARPKRSILVAFVTAEEQGLLGSEWMARHPPIPASQIAADINLDSVNRWGKTTDLGELGLGKSSADAVVKKVAAEQGRTVHGDPFPDRGAFYRSDMFSFARVGVPPVAVKGGPDYSGQPKGWGEQQQVDFERKHYHQPSDEYHGDWDLSGDVQDAQLQLVVGLRLANAPSLPKWVPGDEFEGARNAGTR
jgi:Zn-dependent M28 family amino/carboxypeptidase